MEIEKKEPKVYTIVSEIPIKLELSAEKYTCSYNNDLSHQMASFIMVKNSIDKILELNTDKKRRPFYTKMRYELEEFIQGMGSVLVERLAKQEEADKLQESADAIGLEIVKPS
jgi:hypothetical protein